MGREGGGGERMTQCCFIQITTMATYSSLSLLSR